MDWPATSRYSLDQAPGSLGLVHDFLNTISAGSPRRDDLLATPELTQAWVDGVAATWTDNSGTPWEPITITGTDHERLRQLRDDLRHAITSRHGAHENDLPVPDAASALYTATTAVRLDSRGTVTLEPRGQGWRLFAAVLLVALLDAQQQDRYRRLRICRNPRCGVAFYDHSRNNSGVWHSTKVCGNVENLRALRARRRADTP